MTEDALTHVVTADVASLSLLWRFKSFDKSVVLLTKVDCFGNHVFAFKQKEKELSCFLWNLVFILFDLDVEVSDVLFSEALWQWATLCLVVVKTLEKPYYKQVVAMGAGINSLDKGWYLSERPWLGEVINTVICHVCAVDKSSSFIRKFTDLLNIFSWEKLN